MTELSEAAQAICAQHYNFKSRSSCNACPTGITDRTALSTADGLWIQSANANA